MARLIQGFEELQANLLRLKEGVAKNAMRHATRKAAEIVRLEAERRVEGLASIASSDREKTAIDNQTKAKSGRHKTYLGRTVEPGFLSRNIRKLVFVDKRRGIIRAAIGPSKEAFYGSQFVEIGIPSRGIPARPWLSPSLTANIGNAENEFTIELRKAIKRAIKRGAVK